jgi:hypothetical protein
MDKGRYIWCRKCGAIHHVTDFDRYPVYTGADDEALPANDWRDFMARHAGHRLEPMMATRNDQFPSGSIGDPMSVAHLEISNGAETLLLRRSRRSIDAPFDYEIVKGALVESGASLEIQEQAIRKEMKLHFRWPPATPLSDEQISRFVALFRQIVSRIDPADAQDGLRSDRDEDVSYCRLDAASIENLIASCGTCFPPAELVSLRRFVETHSDADDVMALVKRRAVAVQQAAQ